MGRNTLLALLGLSLLVNGVLGVMLARSRGDSPSVAEPTAVVESPASATPAATVTPTASPAVASPTEEPPVPTPSPTAAPTEAPTSTSTAEPTPSPAPTDTPSPMPEPLPSPTVEALGPDWLRFANLFRTAAKLPPLVENTAWSAESGLHSRYMTLTGLVSHKEDASNPYYTQSGNTAADHGNIALGNLSSAPFEWAFNYWISAPFHAIPLLDPQLATTGFGEYRDPAGVITRVGATLDVERGRGPLPEGVSFPIMWPGDGSVTWVLRYSLPEFPAALSHCAGYSQATGAPVILQIGDGSLTPRVTGAALYRDGQPIDFCQFDETSYTHPDDWTQQSARLILDQRDAIVIIPHTPLLPDSTYAVRVDANGQTYTWSFHTAVGPPR